MLRIERSYYDDFTSGILTSDNKILKNLIYTLELPYINNQNNISCIPTGQYIIKKHSSPKFKSCFLITNVKDRTDILIHAGNTTKDTHGCILVGLKKQDNTIFDSRKALNLMLKCLPNESELIIC